MQRNNSTFSVVTDEFTDGLFLIIKVGHIWRMGNTCSCLSPKISTWIYTTNIAAYVRLPSTSNIWKCWQLAASLVRLPNKWERHWSGLVNEILVAMCCMKWRDKLSMWRPERFTRESLTLSYPSARASPQITGSHGTQSRKDHAASGRRVHKYKCIIVGDFLKRKRQWQMLVPDHSFTGHRGWLAPLGIQ